MNYESKIKNGIQDFILINAFAFQIIVGTISNYSDTSLILKGVSSLILIAVLYIEVTRKNFDLKSFLSSKQFLSPFFYSSLLIIIPALTLIYSTNSEFGLLKLVHFATSPLPAILCFTFIIQLWDDAKTKMVKSVVLVYSVVIPILLISVNPFIYDSIYRFSFSRWSHVILGRFLGATAVIAIYYLIHTENKKERILFFIAATVVLYGVYFIGMRAALLGIAGIIPIIIVYDLIKKRRFTSGTLSLLGAVIIIGAIVLTIGVSEEKETRYKNLTDIENLDFSGDGAVHSRLKAYRISWERFWENPIIGIGYGGFKSFYESDLPILMKYPHNLVLEFLVEMGLMGLILLIIILWRVLAAAWRYDKGMFFYLIFALWLAMFSKDIASQGMLWVGIGLIGGQRTVVSSQ